MGLLQEEIDACREAFTKFDKDGSGTIDASELKDTLNAMGQSPTDEEVFLMISQVCSHSCSSFWSSSMPDMYDIGTLYRLMVWQSI